MISEMQSVDEGKSETSDEMKNKSIDKDKNS